MKRIVCIFLSVMMLLTVIVPVTASGATGTLTASSQNLLVGETVTITVDISGVEKDYPAASIFAEWDADYLSLDSSGTKWTVTGGMGSIDAKGQGVCIGMAPFSLNGTVATYKFTAVGITGSETPANVVVTLQYENDEGEIVKIQSAPVSVYVSGKSFETAPIAIKLDKNVLSTTPTTLVYGEEHTVSVQENLPEDIVNPVVSLYRSPYNVSGEPVEDVLIDGNSETFMDLDSGRAAYYAVLTSDNYNPFKTGNYVIIVKNADMTGCAITLDGTAVTADTEIPYDSANHTVGFNVPDGADLQVYVGEEGYTTADEDKITGNQIVLKDADTAYVHARFLKKGFNPVNLEYKITVTPAEVTVKDVEATKTYDASETTAIPVPELSGIVAADKDKVVLTGYAETVEQKNVTDAAGVNFDITGFALANAGDADVAKNYVLVNDSYTATVKITKAPITVKATDITVMLETINNTENYAPTLEFEVVEGENSKLLGGDTIENAFTGALECEWQAKVGTYAITRGTLASENYAITFEEGTLSVINRVYTAIEIVKPTEKLTYVEGTSFKLSDITVNGTYLDADNNPQTQEDLDASLLNFTPETFEEIGDNITVNVTLKANPDVQDTIVVAVRKTQIESIEITAKQEKYLEGDAFNSEVTVKAVYDNGSPVDDYKNVTVVLESDALDNGKLKPGTWTVTVTAGDTTFKGDTLVETFDITVAEKQVESIAVEVTGDYKSEKYVAGQSFAEKFLNKYPVKVTAKFNNGDLEDVTANAKCNPISLDEDGNLIAGTLVVEYSYTHTADGVKKTVYNKEIQLEVEAVAVSGIVVVTDETFDAEQIEGMELNTTGLTLQVTYNNGNTVTITGNATGVTYSPAVLVLDTPVTVTYGGKSAEVPVTVVAKQLKEIKIEDCEKSYVDGEAFVATTVRAYYDNGSSTKITDYKVNPEVLTLDNAAVAETVTVTVTWNEKTATVAVEVLPCEAINTTTGERYATVEDALTNAADGAVIELQLDAEITSDVTVTADVTIETNGKNITTANDSTINIDDCDVILVNEGAADIVLSVNGKEVTVEAGETAELKSGASDEFIMIEMAKFHMDHFMFNIDVEDTANGTISVGKTYVRINDTVVAKITPDAGYVIEDVLVDGESVGAVSTYTFTKIKSNHVITAVFAEAEAETEAE